MALISTFVAAAIWQLHPVTAAPAPVAASGLASSRNAAPFGRRPLVAPSLAFGAQPLGGARPVGPTRSDGFTRWERDSQVAKGFGRENLARKWIKRGKLRRERLDRKRNQKEGIQDCPGFEPIYSWGPFCAFDEHSRVCAVLLDGDGQPKTWTITGTEYTAAKPGFKGVNFWQITGNGFEYAADLAMRKNDGDSWCVTYKQTAALVKNVGCDAVQIRCESTDVNWLLERRMGGRQDKTETKYQNLKECIRKQCPAGVNTPPIVTEMDVKKKAEAEAKAAEEAAAAAAAAAEAEAAEGEEKAAEEEAPPALASSPQTAGEWSTIRLLVGGAVGAVATALAVRRNTRPGLGEEILLG